jgi:hypothetical protein
MDLEAKPYDIPFCRLLRRLSAKRFVEWLESIVNFLKENEKPSPESDTWFDIIYWYYVTYMSSQLDTAGKNKINFVLARECLA